MRSDDLDRSLPSLLAELAFGVPEGPAYVLNRGDAGLLGSLDRLTPEQASASSQGGASVAAHVEHLRYGLSLLNRWAGGEDPFADADWAAAWRTTTVDTAEWADLQARLRQEVERWHAALREPRELRGPDLDTAVGSVVHLAYHLGAIRQIVAALRGPRELIALPVRVVDSVDGWRAA